MKKNQRITPSIERSIIALNHTMIELEHENVRLTEEYSYQNNIIELMNRKKKEKKAVAKQMMAPVLEMKNKTENNLNEIKKFKNENKFIKKKISKLQERLETKTETAEFYETETDSMFTCLVHYQELLKEYSQPKPLPYPYTIDSEINWSIANRDTIEMPPDIRQCVELLHSYEQPFISLEMSDKRVVMHLIKQAKQYAESTLTELKHLELKKYEGEDPSKIDILIRKTVKIYAVLANSIQCVRF